MYIQKMCRLQFAVFLVHVLQNISKCFLLYWYMFGSGIQLFYTSGTHLYTLVY